MRDRRAHRILADIAALREAERAAAHHEVVGARSREHQATEAVNRADARTTAAAEAWDAHIASAFAPELARALADEVVRHGEASATASDHRERMREARSDAEQAWHDGDARCRLADRALADRRREMRRNRDEQALAAQADRIASKWRRA